MTQIAHTPMIAFLASVSLTRPILRRLSPLRRRHHILPPNVPHRSIFALTTSPSPNFPSPNSSSNPSDPNMFATDKSFTSLGVSSPLAHTLATLGIATPTKTQASVVPILLSGLDMQLEYAAQIRAYDQAKSALEKNLVQRVVNPAPSESLTSPDMPTPSETPISDLPLQSSPLPDRPSRLPEDVNDVLMIGAETGSGKTLAYLLPYVQAVRTATTDLKAVILVPSRELCSQIATFLTSYFETPPPHIVLAGGQPPDVADIKAVKVVIATPTALLNYFRFNPKHDASDKYIVIDEADMLLSGAFLPDVERILNQPGMKPFATRKNSHLIDANRNRLLFIGATYPHWTGDRVKSIITWMRRRYPNIQAVQTEAIHKRSTRLTSRWQYLTDENARIEALHQILSNELTSEDKVMVFASKADTVRRICETMQHQLGETFISEHFGSIVQLHKLVRTEERASNLENFRNGEARLLFCTDLASRGLDLGSVTRVVEFEFASNVVAYLHRIGRTARAGLGGVTDHFYDEVSRPLAEAIQQRAEKETTVVEGVFSRKRSFRRKFKKKMGEESVVKGLEDVEIDEADEEEKARWRGED